MESSTVQIKNEFEDLPEKNLDLVKIEVKSLKENNSASDFMNNAFCSLDTRSEYEEDNYIARGNQFDTNHANSKKCQKLENNHLQNHEACLNKATLYECEICHRKFKREDSLRYHWTSHDTNRKTYKCDLCDKVFVSKDNLLIHETMTHLLENYQCEVCGQKFKKRNALTKHLECKHKNKEVFEKDHNESNRAVRSQKLAVENDVPVEEELKVCLRVDGKIRKKRTHLPPIKCYICNKSYVNRTYLLAHIKQHNDTQPQQQTALCVCDICGKAFKNRRNLSRHKRIHRSDRKTYSCDLCDKLFKCKNGLRVHQVISHSTEEKYQCKLCAEKFKAHYQLRRHVLKHMKEEELVEDDHTESDGAEFRVHQQVDDEEQTKKNFKCHICNESYVKECLLSEHLEQHTKESRPGETSGKELKGESDLHAHKGTHQNGRKLYECNFCDKVFTYRGNMRRHQIKIHLKNKYECIVCGKKFDMYHMLKVHIRKHKEEEELVENHHMGPNEVVQPTETDSSESVCKICQADCSAEGLEPHMSSHDLKPLKCECSGVFFSESEYKKHIKDDCEVVRGALGLAGDCEVQNDVKEELEIGVETIMGEYEDGSEVVDQLKVENDASANEELEFDKSKEIVKTHTNLNDEEHNKQRYACNQCGNTYKHLTSLRSHLRCHTKEPFKCTICDKEFAFENFLYDHFQQHIDETFKCEICGKVFRKKSTFEYHKRTHRRDGKAYECDLCHKWFKFRRSRTIHRNTIHSLEKYQCELCGKFPMSYCQLNKHLRTHKKKSLAGNHRTESSEAAQPTEIDSSV